MTPEFAVLLVVILACYSVYFWRQFREGGP